MSHEDVTAGQDRTRIFRTAGRDSCALILQIDSSPASVRSALGEMLQKFPGQKSLPCLKSDLELVIAEVVNNIVEHAYRGRPDGHIGLHLHATQDGVECIIEDRGESMPSGKLPQGTVHDLDCARDDLPEGGFGWHIIRELVTDLNYERRNGRNRLRFRFTPDSCSSRVN